MWLGLDYRLISLFVLLPGLWFSVAAQTSGPILAQGDMMEDFGISIHRVDADDLARIRSLGMRYARSDLHWARIERIRGEYDWASFDQRIAQIVAADLRPVLILAYSNPLYESPSESPQSASGWSAPLKDDSRSAYIKWAKAAVLRYKHYNPVWEIWNEPDAEQFWPPRADADAYIRLALATCEAIRSIAPESTIWGPALSSINNDHGRDSDFLLTVLASPLSDCLSAISLHPYLSLNEVGDLGSYWQMIHALPEAGGRSFVASEWGFSSAFTGMNDDMQASYVIRLAALSHMEGGRPVLWYTWRNEGEDPGIYTHNYGLVFPDDQPKPAFLALEVFRKATLGRERQCLLSVGELTQLFAFSLSDTDEVLMIVWAAPGRFSPSVSGRLDIQLPPRAKPIDAYDLYGESLLINTWTPLRGSGKAMPYYIRYRGDLPEGCAPR